MAQPSIIPVPELSERSVDAGASCLNLLDEHGFEVQGAAWIYSSYLDEWRYYIVTDLVEIDGPRETYERIEKLFELSFNNADLMIDDVHLGSPREHVFKVLTSVFQIESKKRKARRAKNIIVVQNIQIKPEEGRPYLVEKAFLYRLNPRPPKIRIMKKRKAFDRHLRELERAAHQ